MSVRVLPGRLPTEPDVRENRPEPEPVPVV
jgi:hypothetical protein